MKQEISLSSGNSPYGSRTLDVLSYGEALFSAAQEDPRIVALGADLTRATESARMRDRMPDRFFSLGIQEANMIGAAAGMARCGDMPFVHSFCVFVTRRVYDQIAMQLAYPCTNVKVAGFLPGLSTALGVSHQAIDDIALMRALPNMVVIEPCGPEQIAAAVRAATQHRGPVYLRLDNSRGPSPFLQDHGPLSVLRDGTTPLLDLELGKGQVLAEGADVAILASGMTVREAFGAKDLLTQRGIFATVVNFHTLKPFDSDLVLTLAKSHRALVTVENHSLIGGLGAVTAEALGRAGTSTRLATLGIADVFAQGGATSYLFSKHGIDASHIAAKAIELCGQR